MMRAALSLILALIAGFADARPRGAPATPGYFWANFQAGTSGPLKMLQSADGVTWGNRAVSYTPCNAGGYVRDPSIALFSAEGKHYIVHTNTTFGVANTTFDLAVSSDNASTFTCVQQIDMSSVSSGANSQIWAPEWAHNADGTPWLDPNIGGCPRVYVAASSTGLSDTGFQIYETHPTNCSDFSQPWTAPTLVTGTSLPNNMIDAYPYVSGSTINLWIKNENDKYIGYLTSTTSAPTSGYVVTKSGDWAGWGTPLEGESIVQMPGGVLRIYLDAEASGYTYSDSADGGVTWSGKQSVYPAYALQHGTVIPSASVVPPPQPDPGPTAATTCNLNTGSCTGQDAGTGLFTAAVCDGVTNTLSALNSFNTWALTSTAQAQGKLIEARISGTCFASGGNARPFKGLTKVRLWGYGATFTGSGAMPGLGVADTIPGICHKALDNASGCSARINTVSAGATSVTINLTGYSGSLSTLCSRFTTGKWAVITGFDLQGLYNVPFGYPPNPHFLDYVQIGSTANCASTGAISISRPLTYAYLSTWPNFNSGNTSEADQGGPGTIYALDQYWGGEVDLRGFTLTDASNQSIYQGRTVAIKDVTVAGSTCIIPSQNETFTMTNVIGSNCDIEVDKLVNSLNYSNTYLRRLKFQSSSIDTLTWDGGALANDMNGTPKVANISNLTTPTLKLGPYAYGVARSATCTNCVVTNPITGFGLTDAGTTFYTVSGGVFSYPLGQNVTGVADNGSGLVRLTVADTTGWKTGAFAGQSGLWSACTVPGGCTGGLQLTVIDSTHIDIQYSFSQVTWSAAGFIYNRAEQERWAVPGTNFFTTGQWPASSGAYQTTGVTQSGGFVNIATTIPGAFPTVPLSGGTAGIRVQAPYWTCTNCSGSAQMVDFSGAPPNIPLFSYSKRTFNNSSVPLSPWNLWGKVTSIKINVTQSYTGSTNPLRVNFPEETVIPAGTTSFWSPLIDLRTAGLRTITPAGVTCDTGGGPVAGGCGSDSGLTLPDPAAMFAGTIEQQMPNGTPTDQPWTMTAEFIMDQGVVP